MMRPYRPRDFFWDLALPTPRLFYSPFDDFHNDPDLHRVERAMERSFEDMNRHFRDTFGEIEAQARGGFEIANNPDKLQLKFDVHEYRPEELVVKTNQHALIVEGNHEERDERGEHYSRRSFIRKFALPREVDPNTVVSHLSSDGKLLVEAPKLALPAPPGERMIAIEHNKE